MKGDFNTLNELQLHELQLQRAVLRQLASPGTELSITDLSSNFESRHKTGVNMHNLEKGGLVKVRHERSPKYVTVRFYRITDKGLSFLNNQPSPVA